MNHLELLRNEHVRLQTRHAELQRRCDVLEADRALRCVESGVDASASSSNGFIKRLTETVMQLYEKDLYSDITIHIDGHQIRAHRLVLAARSDAWGDLLSTDRLDLEGISYSDAKILVKWMYTDAIDDQLGDSIILSLLNASVKYEMDDLKNRCETMLIGRLEVDNCVKIYQFAETNALDRLRNCCTEFVSARWRDFQPRHFTDMAAPLLYEMLKARSRHLLNAIITLEREDVLFLYLIENNILLSTKLNEFDEHNKLPLDLAFETGQLNVAKTLVANGAAVNEIDHLGLSFLWKAIQQDNLGACKFLIENGADAKFVNESSGENLLHALAQRERSPEIVEWARNHIGEFVLNAVNTAGRTALMTAVEAENREIFDLIIAQEATDVNLRDFHGKTALEIALLEKRDVTMADRLAAGGRANLGYVDSATGETLFHKAIAAGDFVAIQFLVKYGADVNKTNANGSTPLHLFLASLPSQAAMSDNNETTQFDRLRILLKAGADPTLKESRTGSTPLHFAVERDKNVLKTLLEFYSKDLPLSVLDKEGRSPLWCALLVGKFDCARLLLDAGADVDEQKNTPLLIRAIEAKRDDIARFLLDNKAIAAVTTADGFSCLSLAVKNGLTPTVDYLCKLGANLNHPHPNTNLPPLWTALENGDYGTAEVLVGHGCDCEGWALNMDVELEETLLHRAIDLRNEKAALFLIKSGCNVNALRRLPNPGYLESVRKKKQITSPTSLSDKSEVNPTIRQTPLHASVQWGQAEVTKALVSNLNCKIDAQDYDGRTAAHLAIIEHDRTTLDLLLSHPDPSTVLSVRDRHGYTPLATAIRMKNNKAAEAICQRIPYAALQVNGSGENLLHTAVKTNDLESVLFLLGLQIDVKISTQNQDRQTALHICADIGNELILRNLLLAGADVNMNNAHNETALHVAARKDHAEICGILLENGADPNIADINGNNALHVAVSNGSMNATQLLLLESEVDCMAVNKKRQNIMHLCAINVGIISAEIFLTILEIHPKFPLEMADMYGNTMFLLSFLNGNSELCRYALRHGACMGTINHQGQSVFNIDTPTKQLLFGLLDGLDREPRWADGDQCSECGMKFTLTTRKHHCRHCGRLVCAKCSEHQMPLLKYEISKNVRVCQICFDVLTTGDATNSHILTKSNGNNSNNNSYDNLT